jgi:hypothetical protein
MRSYCNEAVVQGVICLEFAVLNFFDDFLFDYMCLFLTSCLISYLPRFD